VLITFITQYPLISLEKSWNQKVHQCFWFLVLKRTTTTPIKYLLLSRKWSKNFITAQKPVLRTPSRNVHLLQKSTIFPEEFPSSKRISCSEYVLLYPITVILGSREQMYLNRSCYCNILGNKLRDLLKNMTLLFLTSIGREYIQRSNTKTMVSQFRNLMVKKFTQSTEFGLQLISITLSYFQNI